MAIAGPVIRIWIRRVSPRRHYHPIHRGSRLWSRIVIFPRGFLPGGEVDAARHGTAGGELER